MSPAALLVLAELETVYLNADLSVSASGVTFTVISTCQLLAHTY